MSSISIYRPSEDVECERLAQSLVEEDLETRAKGLRIVGDGVDVPLPDSLVGVLQDVAEAFARGRSISVSVVNDVLSTQQAADLLNVSRPTLVALLDEGKIPYERVRTHRKLRREDVEAYLEEHRRGARVALDEMALEAIERGEHEITKSDAVAAVKRLRSSRR